MWTQFETWEKTREPWVPVEMFISWGERKGGFESDSLGHSDMLLHVEPSSDSSRASYWSDVVCCLALQCFCLFCDLFLILKKKQFLNFNMVIGVPLQDFVLSFGRLESPLIPAGTQHSCEVSRKVFFYGNLQG